MRQTKIEDLGTQHKADEPFPNIQKREQKPWYQCQTKDCHYIKAGPRANFCKTCLHKKHQQGQAKTTLRIIIKLRGKE